MKVRERGQVPWNGQEGQCETCNSRVIADSGDRPVKVQKMGMGVRKCTFECVVCGQADVVIRAQIEPR